MAAVIPPTRSRHAVPLDCPIPHHGVDRALPVISRARPDFSGRRLVAGMCRGTERSVPGASSPTAHLVGVCGSGMQALAELLVGMGWRVSGSDQQAGDDVIQALGRRGPGIHRGHAATHLPPQTDVLVYSQAIGPGNVERIQAADRGIPQLSLSQMLGRLMSVRTGVSIAGTHGKSTTTAMTASLLDSAGLSPSAVVGARLVDRGSSGWAGTGDLLVVESCEYRRSFLDLVPRYAVITGIEPDHFDCYGSLGEMTEAFGAFAASIDRSGLLLVPADCPASAVAAERTTARVKTIGRRPGADWWAADIRRTAAGSCFRLFRDGEFCTEIMVPVPGRHNVDNALAAAALAFELGVDPDQVRQGLLKFSGLRRRFQPMGTWRGVTMIDDYAHHPTAIRATLETARERFGGRRLWCAFQPHQVSRTVALFEEFASSLGMADRVLVLPVHAARENGGSAALVSQELAERIEGTAPQTRCRFVRSLDRLVATLDDETRPGDVLITMGAGDIDRVQHEFTR